jgi:hypothetical protein
MWEFMGGLYLLVIGGKGGWEVGPLEAGGRSVGVVWGLFVMAVGDFLLKGMR